MIGKIESDNQVPLLPVCHSIQDAHIQIAIDYDGNFLRATVVPRENKKTIIPCTEEAAGRAGSRPEGYPLCDSLQFVAGDFVEYGGLVTSGYSKNPLEPHATFVEKLEAWCNSKYRHEKAISILAYAKKKKVITDLVSVKILHIENEKLIVETKEQLRKRFGSDDKIPQIFQVIQADQKDKTINQERAFIRWCVEKAGELESQVWRDRTLWDSWINYYVGLDSAEGLCYVSGRKSRLAIQHPKRIRRGNDNAKLISSNDTSGFTFRGRFVTAEQACGVSSDATQKAHSALRWLISRQGYRKGAQAIVAWAISGARIPNPVDDASDILGEENLASDESEIGSTAQELALKLKKKIAGYKADLGATTDIVIMGLDSATPGRMAIMYYQELTGSDFLERLEHWHESCAWIHDYRFIEKKEENRVKRKYVRFVGAPAPKDIAKAVYGKKVDDKLQKAVVERILPCIIEGRVIPRDIVESAVRRACNRVGLEYWEWNKVLSIACALYRKLNEKEGYIMALDEDRKTRDYLYGRLLALADSLERWALNKAGEDRQTNADRLMQRFAERPYSTWRTIELSLSPYKARLGAQSQKRQMMIDKVKDMFSSVEDFKNDKKLNGEFLLAYSCQREALRLKRDNVNKNEPESVA